MGLLLCLAPRWASGQDNAQWWFERDDEETALELARAATEADPDDPEAAWIRLLVWEDRPSLTGSLLDEFEARWQKRASPINRALYARALRVEGDTGMVRRAWCERLSGLLDGPRGDTFSAYLLARTALQTKYKCPIDEVAWRRVLERAGKKDWRAERWRLQDGITSVDARWIADAEAFIERTGELRFFTWLWDQGAAGPELARARELALDQATAALGSGDEVRLWGALQIRRTTLDAEQAEAVRLELLALDPSPPGLDTPETERVLWTLVRNATWRSRPEERLAALEELADRVPEDGPLRRRFEVTRARVLDDLDRQPERLEALYAAWKATPDSAWAANRFAWNAAVLRRRLDDAVKVADGAIAALRPEVGVDPDASKNLGVLLDTLAWVHAMRGEWSTAVPLAEEAVERSPHPHHSIRLAAVLFVTGARDRARELLSLALAGSARGPWVRFGRSLATSLDSDSTLGPEAEIAEALAARETDETVSSGRHARNITGHHTVGARLADVSVVVDGRDLRLSDLGERVVIEFWATWCDPCQGALSTFESAARRLAGPDVTFVALAVHDELDRVQAYFGDRALPFTVAVVTQANMWKLLGIRAIPEAVALDRGVIRARWSHGDLDNYEDAVRLLVR